LSIVVMLNGFLHDLCAAWWMISALLIRYTLGLSPESAGPVPLRLVRFLQNSMLGSLVGVIVFGAFRLWSYKTYEWVEAAGDAQVTLLAVKHVFFVVIVVLGLVQWRKARAFLRMRENS
jgi:hypothetical protein